LPRMHKIFAERRIKKVYWALTGLKSIPKSDDLDSYPKILCNYNYDNAPLPRGTYTTGFSSEFVIANGSESYIIENKSFTVNFKID